MDTPERRGTEPPGWRRFFQETNVSISRAEYFKDLLQDCHLAALDYPKEDRAVLMAALILSDSLNGIRKTLLQQRSYYDKD